MISLVLKTLIIITLIISVQVAYNSFVFQKIDKLKWIKFVVASVIFIIVSYALYQCIPYIIKLPVISTMDKIINKFILNLVQYIRVPIVILYFIVPLIITFIYFIISGLLKRNKLKRNYRLSKDKNKKILEGKTKASQDSDINEHKLEVTQLETMDNSIEEISEEINTRYDLDESIVLKKVRYQSILGVQRAYEQAKKDGLVVGETETGHIAVYANVDGLKDLKILFSQLGIDIANLKTVPSLVFFEKNKLECLSIKEELNKMIEERRKR